MQIHNPRPRPRPMHQGRHSSQFVLGLFVACAGILCGFLGRYALTLGQPQSTPPKAHSPPENCTWPEAMDLCPTRFNLSMFQFEMQKISNSHLGGLEHSICMYDVGDSRESDMYVRINRCQLIPNPCGTAVCKPCQLKTRHKDTSEASQGFRYVGLYDTDYQCLDPSTKQVLPEVTDGAIKEAEKAQKHRKKSRHPQRNDR